MSLPCMFIARALELCAVADSDRPMAERACQTFGYPREVSPRRMYEERKVPTFYLYRVFHPLTLVLEDVNDLLIRGGFLRQVRFPLYMRSRCLTAFRPTLGSFTCCPLVYVCKIN